MHVYIEKLMEGDRSIVSYFVAAKERWAGILADVGSVDVDVLADRLTGDQNWFERNCGGRLVGQEIMVIAGFGSIFSTSEGYRRPGLGFPEANKLLQAFHKSVVSVEIKQLADEIAESYWVE